MEDMETRTETQDVWRCSGRQGDSADYTEKKFKMATEHIQTGTPKIRYIKIFDM